MHNSRSKCEIETRTICIFGESEAHTDDDISVLCSHAASQRRCESVVVQEFDVEGALGLKVTRRESDVNL